MSLAPFQPLPYDPSFEYLEKNEAETTAELGETMLGISQKTFSDNGHATRSVHAKSHALLQGRLTVLDNLPPYLAQGLFGQAGSYDTVMRLSTTPGDIMSDAVTTPRGLSLKIMGVPGARVDGSENETTQDFLMVNGPAFQVRTAKAFLDNVKLLAATTDRSEALKIALSTAMRGLEATLELVGVKSGKVMSMGGQPLVHPFGDTYYTQVPVLFGAYMAKISLAPVSPNLVALNGAKIELNGRTDMLREEAAAIMTREGGTWELRAQLCTDIEEMPIENPMKVWPEDVSPYVAVATLTVAAQPSWTAEKASIYDDNLTFNPWHALAAHRPLGVLNRIRKIVYPQSVDFRRRHNGCPLHEPRSVEDLKPAISRTAA